MTLPYPISPSQTDAKSPVDDDLMDSIRLDLEYLEGLLTTTNPVFNFNINGPLITANGIKKALDTAINYKAISLVASRAVVKKSGLSGAIVYDIRRHASPNVPITGISHQFDGLTQSISNVNPALATQSIARSTTQISTQSISFVKGSVNVTSVIQVAGTNLWRYNLAVAPDADWHIGDYVTFASMTAGGNNGTLAIVEVNQSGGLNVVVSNPTGVAQTGAAGTAQLMLMSYNFTNPVSSEFVAGERAVFASHTSAANDGTLLMYAVNSGGNNIQVMNANGVVQAGVAGNANNSRWKYVTLTTPSTTDFVVGEAAVMTSHSTGANNGALFPITAVNQGGGNNIVVYNPLGVAQGGVAGAIGTNRWVYALSSDPSADVTAGQFAQLENHTTAANNFSRVEVKQVNRSGNNIVIYNPLGVVQAGVAGNTRSTRKVVKFATDQSAVFTTLSFVEMDGCPSGLYNQNVGLAPFSVLQVNRGGGANFNIVIDNAGAPLQASPAGFVTTEMKSIFNAPPSIAASVTGLKPNTWLKNTSVDFIAQTIPESTPLGLYITSMHTGAPEDLSVILY